MSIDVLAAAARVAPHVHRTPVLRSRLVDERVGAQVLFKCENFQRMGAFKMRGASNAVFALGDEAAKRGVVTHSSGNFAQALALAARERGITATIVMPEGAPPVKRAAVEGYGGRIVSCANTIEAREEAARRVVAETGATFVHSYDDPLVIAGQGTLGLELFDEVPDLDLLLVPVGGGGLCSGVLAARDLVAPRCRVVGVEPQGADDARRSLRARHREPLGTPRTICDGLRTPLSERTFALFAGVEDVCTVTDAEVLEAMRWHLGRMKLVVEPSGAVGLALLLAGRAPVGTRVGVVISGGNVDLETFDWRPADGSGSA